jgi:hypothetical protein
MTMSGDSKLWAYQEAGEEVHGDDEMSTVT